MAMYHISKDTTQIQEEILPSKKLFIIDLYKTLILWDHRNNKNILRNGTHDFLNQWMQTKVLYSDAKRKTILDSLHTFELEQYFSRVYSEEHVNFQRPLGNFPLMHKYYEEVARLEGFLIEDAIVIEDFSEESNQILDNHQIDIIKIPVQYDKRSVNFGQKSSREYNRHRKKVNGYSFNGVLPLELIAC
ncbi:MAG: hypothetical protein PF569_06330 [Candidatus Woesearchaeota archaeon]|jgi:hypothetical protein|nr:hypothetical protein [Candidatus Woesearchaeota archaeon]